MNKKFVIRPKLVISVLFPFIILGLFSCNKKNESPGPANPNGHGSGTFDFSLQGALPQNFNANVAGSFALEIVPHIDTSYSGSWDVVFNRFHFELAKGGSVYRSNYVEFVSQDSVPKELEWGGSLPSGSYNISGILQNIQLNMSGTDKVYAKKTNALGTINITQFTSPNKVMKIEYFCQASDDTNIIKRYDIFLSPNTVEYMNIAFNIANTRDSVITYSNNQLTSLVEFEPIFRREIINYIYTFKVWGNEMFLCGIKGFKDPLGNYLPQVTGVTYFFSNPVATCSTGSLVAVKACIDLVANEYKIDYNDFVTATTIHELGHQRASILHEDYHNSQFCTMNLGLVVVGERNRYSNPHFCGQCIARLKNIIW